MSTTTLDAPTHDTGRARRGRRPLVLLMALAVAIAGLTVLTNPGTADAGPVPRYPAYQPQTNCSPAAKKGTLYLARWLQRRYQGSGSYGISRSCSSGGTSEHKEGRAFDWALDASKKKHRVYAKKFRHYLLKKNKRGARAARARRMGVMYFIWNDRIWSSYNHYRPRPYVHAACSSKYSCSKTLRHRDHMHISLTRRGGKAKTKWFRWHMRR